MKRRSFSVREVPIPPQLMRDLDAFFAITEHQRAGVASEHLFPWSRTTAWRIVKQVMEKANVSGVRACPKGLRHAFGTSAISCVPLNIVSRWMGHSQFSTTAIYAAAIGPEEVALGDPDPAKLVAAFREVCDMAFDDGVTFDAGGITVDRIREENDYGGVRLRTMAVIDGARVRVVIDIAFGDATEPGLVDLDLPVLLDQPQPRLRAYAQETVIAEKFQAMVTLGRANSRMKDLYDVWMLSKTYRFEDDRLARAIAATFARREAAIPTELPDALSPAFADDPAKQEQWAAFVRELGHDPGPLPLIVSDLAKFLMPHAAKAAAND